MIFIHFYDRTPLCACHFSRSLAIITVIIRIVLLLSSLLRRSSFAPVPSFVLRLSTYMLSFLFPLPLFFPLPSSFVPSHLLSSLIPRPLLPRPSHLAPLIPRPPLTRPSHLAYHTPRPPHPSSLTPRPPRPSPFVPRRLNHLDC